MAKPKSPLDELFPPDEAGPATMPTSLRFTASLLARIDRLAEERGVTRTAVIEKLLAYALDELGEPTLEEMQARRRRKAGR